jgi:hypothetical protein
LAPAFNRSVRVEAREEELSGDAVAVLVRDILERTHGNELGLTPVRDFAGADASGSDSRGFHQIERNPADAASAGP